MDSQQNKPPEQGPEIDVIYTGSGPDPRDPAPVGDIFAETADKIFGRAQLVGDLDTQKALQKAVERLRISRPNETGQERRQREKDLALRESLLDGINARLIQHPDVSDQ